MKGSTRTRAAIATATALSTSGISTTPVTEYSASADARPIPIGGWPA